MKLPTSAMLVAAATLLLVVATPAWAQPSPAQVLFDEGHEAYDRGDYEVACDKFAKSQKLEPAGGTLMSLADCEERIGEFLAARSHYNAALTLFTPPDPRIPFVQERLAKLTPRIPTITLRIASSAPENTSVELNGFSVMASELGGPIEVNPGVQTVVVSAPGYTSNTQERDLQAGQSVELVLEPGPRAPPPKPAIRYPDHPSDPGENGRDYTAAFVVGGISLAVGVVAVALSARAFTHYGDLSETCAPRPGGCSEEERDAVKTEALASNILYGVAGAGALATVFLFAFAPESDADTVSVVAGPDTVSLRIRF